MKKKSKNNPKRKQAGRKAALAVVSGSGSSKERHYEMDGGHMLGREPNKPALFIVPDGKLSYLWVGNNAPDDMACFATLAGSANLRRLARDILLALDGPNK